MQDKYDIMGRLTPELQNETAKNLSNKDIVSVALTSMHHLRLFNPIVDARQLSQFFYHVTHGNHEAVMSMLAGDMSLFYRKGQVTDCSGRTFENISGFEYTLWALDKHMWTTILECLPDNEKGIEVFKLLKGQCDNLDNRGVTYSLNGQKITEKHFDFKNTLINELQTQVDLVNAPGVQNNQDAIDTQWREGVGGAQKQLPMHVVDEYCSNESFYPIPKFISQPKSSKQFYNWDTHKSEDWFNVDSKLGSELAIYKGRGALLGRRKADSWQVEQDLAAMKVLCDLRTLDFTNLKSELAKQAGLENHHQVIPLK